MCGGLYDWLFSLRMMFSRLFYVVACTVLYSFLTINKYTLYFQRNFSFIENSVESTEFPYTAFLTSPTVFHIIILYQCDTLGFTFSVVHSIGFDKCIMTYVYIHYSIIQDSFIALKIPCYTWSSPSYQTPNNH